MATIPARTASGSRYQTAASSATSVGIASGSMRFPCRSAVAVATPPPERAGGQTASPFASPVVPLHADTLADPNKLLASIRSLVDLA